MLRICNITLYVWLSDKVKSYTSYTYIHSCPFKHHFVVTFVATQATIIFQSDPMESWFYRGLSWMWLRTLCNYRLQTYIIHQNCLNVLLLPHGCRTRCETRGTLRQFCTKRATRRSQLSSSSKWKCTPQKYSQHTAAVRKKGSFL